MKRLDASDASAAVGTLSIAVDYHKGSGKELVFEQKNLIVKDAKRYLLSGLYLAGVTSDPIVSLKVGTGGNIDPQGLYPKPEDPDQTNLIAPVISVATVYTLDLPNITATFLADIDQGQANGSMLTEAGLFLASGKIFNVKNHPGITKTSQFSVHYSWAIKFL
jgi:hypothetical protein